MLSYDMKALLIGGAMRDRIKELRTSFGLTQVKFAKILGVSVASLRRWEAGDASPSPMAIARIEEVSKYTTEQILQEYATLEEPTVKSSDDAYKVSFFWKGQQHEAVWMPYVINGPTDQLDFYNLLLKIQVDSEFDISSTTYFKRLSMLKSVDGVPTSQYLLEKPNHNAKCWSSDYGTHGFHRYVGRFPSHLIRSLINAFGANENDVILDPFSGSGTTLVESRMLGIPAIGIEISPLSAMISRVKSQFSLTPINGAELIDSLSKFYNTKWEEFYDQRSADLINHQDVLNRPGNAIPKFANIERWFTPEALLGTSIVVEYILYQKGYVKDFLTIALSAKMRSIGNVDVDVVRAEYRKTPRENVNVLKLMKSQIQKMLKGINDTLSYCSNVLLDESSVQVIENNVLATDLPDQSVSHIITSPPYGVESLSYLRTHLLSFRALEPILGVDPYNFGENVIGSEYLDGAIPDVNVFKVKNASNTYLSFFSKRLSNSSSNKDIKRIMMMMKFFEDMYCLIEKFSHWIKPNGHVAFIIGNKKLGDEIIPTDTIIDEIFMSFGFDSDGSIAHKLKTNNSNSQVPWQERIIENEFIMLYTKVKQ